MIGSFSRVLVLRLSLLLGSLAAVAAQCGPGSCLFSNCKDCAADECCHWCATGDSVDDDGVCRVYSPTCAAPYNGWDSGVDFNCARQKLSAGAIAGIVIGCVVFIGIICCIVMACKRRRNAQLMQPQGGSVIVMQQGQPMMVQQQPGVVMMQPGQQQQPQQFAQQQQYGQPMQQQQGQPMYNGQPQPMQGQYAQYGQPQPVQYAQQGAPYGSQQPQFTQGQPPAY